MGIQKKEASISAAGLGASWRRLNLCILKYEGDLDTER